MDISHHKLMSMVRQQADPDHWNLDEDGLKNVCRIFMSMNNLLINQLAGIWINGKPTAPGLWIVDHADGDRFLVTVTEETGGDDQSILYANCERFSEPLDHADGQLTRVARRSFGPIPEPEETP